MNRHLLFILGVNAPQAAFSSLLFKSIAYMHFIHEMDPWEEITQSSRSEIRGEALFFYFKDDRQPEKCFIE